MERKPSAVARAPLPHSDPRTEPQKRLACLVRMLEYCHTEAHQMGAKELQEALEAALVQVAAMCVRTLQRLQ